VRAENSESECAVSVVTTVLETGSLTPSTLMLTGVMCRAESNAADSGAALALLTELRNACATTLVVPEAGEGNAKAGGAEGASHSISAVLLDAVADAATKVAGEAHCTVTATGASPDA
jgi:hypothetical protein